MMLSLNVIGQGVTSFLTNPKYAFKAAYMSIMIFGAFHFSRMVMSIGSMVFL
jgi:hypothetical protein